MTGSVETATAKLQRTEQLVISAGLLLLASLAWFRTVQDAQGMSCVMMMPGMHGAWWVGCPLYMASWAVMMAAMMLPAAAPMVLLFARLARGRPGPRVSAWFFVLGYGLTWAALGVPAYFGTVALQALCARFPALEPLGPTAAALFLILAGIYQWTPLKNACLAHCRSPLHFVLHEWHDGHLGAVRMGATHGVVCAGCCAGLMAVLFALGIMSLSWMAVVAVAMTLEKILPGGLTISRVTGALLMAAGVGSLSVPSVSHLLFGT